MSPSLPRYLRMSHFYTFISILIILRLLFGVLPMQMSARRYSGAGFRGTLLSLVYAESCCNFTQRQPPVVWPCVGLLFCLELVVPSCCICLRSTFKFSIPFYITCTCICSHICFTLYDAAVTFSVLPYSYCSCYSSRFPGLPSTRPGVLTESSCVDSRCRPVLLLARFCIVCLAGSREKERERDSHNSASRINP